MISGMTEERTKRAKNKTWSRLQETNNKQEKHIIEAQHQFN